MNLYNYLFRSAIIFFILLLSTKISDGQVYDNENPLAHTFSIVAIDTTTGEMAAAVQSHWFSVGTIVVWGKSGVGVVATQSFVNPAYGPDGLKLMEQDYSAREALKKLVEEDPGQKYRQVAFLNKKGEIAAHTGKSCIESANHIIGNNYSVQANMMLNDNVVPAMAEAFEKNNSLPLPERIITVLQAAQKAGGDIRGKQSAALIVVNPKPVNNIWQDKKIDLRIDDHKNPIEELSRLLKVHRAYEHMNKGDLAIEHGEMNKALEEYAAAEALFPDNLEMKYWKAIALANNNRTGEALPIFQYIFKKDKNWLLLTKRLPKAGLLDVSEEDYNRITNCIN